ncbi:MAG: ATP-binding cassette domain-containing protein, partial [Rhodospirillaceae bacterium]|nr:ATP-binding cassette domain-containing protein [Rhodospirillaceae bacterium]
MSEALELRSVWIALGGRLLIAPLSLVVPAGTVATIMGPSGCGKSSLLSHLCGTLDRAFRAGGEVLLGGRRLDTLAPEERRLGILFQDDLLFPHLSVGGNLAFGLPPGVPRAERRRRVEAA